MNVIFTNFLSLGGNVRMFFVLSILVFFAFFVVFNFFIDPKQSYAQQNSQEIEDVRDVFLPTDRTGLSPLDREAPSKQDRQARRAFLKDRLIQKAREKQSVRVVAILDVPEALPDSTFTLLSRDQRKTFLERRKDRSNQDKKDRIRRVGESLKDRVRPKQSTEIKTFDHIPVVSLEVDEVNLSTLFEDPSVLHVEEDRYFKPVLDSSIPLTRTDEVHAQGFDGRGHAVAILDSGQVEPHGFLDHIVHEACFSSDFHPFFDVETLCPNGEPQQIGPGSSFCPPGLVNPQGYGLCYHGGLVAGVAAGSGHGNAPPGVVGVAPEAPIVMIQVFQKINDLVLCTDGVPCALSSTSDLLLGLDHVLTLQEDPSFSTPIASVNISIGGGAFEDQALCDEEYASIALMIELLREENIATVIGSGNSGSLTSIAAPACVSPAFSVGSSSDYGRPSLFTDTNDLLEFYAPGEDIISSFDSGDGSFARGSGTSLAAPHIAGSWAILKHVRPDATVGMIYNSLRRTGLLSNDLRDADPEVRRPFFNLLKAKNHLESIAERRDSPGGVSDGLVTWLRPDREYTLTPTWNFIRTIHDQSGLGYDGYSFAGIYPDEPTVFEFNGRDMFYQIGSHGLEVNGLAGELYDSTKTLTGYMVTDINPYLDKTTIFHHSFDPVFPERDLAKISIGEIGVTYDHFTSGHSEVIASPASGARIVGFVLNGENNQAHVDGVWTSFSEPLNTLMPDFHQSGEFVIDPIFNHLGDIIFYNRTLELDEQQRVESYLALAHGLTLDQHLPRDYHSSNGTVIWDAHSPFHQAFGHDIAGVGRDDQSGLLISESRSHNDDSILNIELSDSSSIEDQSFLLVGNNNSPASFTNNLAPEGYSVLERTWSAQKTGYVGPVHLKFYQDHDNFDVPYPPVGRHYSIVFDTTRNGSFEDETPIEIPLVGGPVGLLDYTFDEDLMFTLAVVAEEDLPREDVNGDGSISIVDAALIQRAALGLSMDQTPWVLGPTTGDVDCNSLLSILDAALTQRKALGLSMLGTPWCGS